MHQLCFLWDLTSSKQTSAHLTSRPAAEEVAAVHGTIRTLMAVSLIDVQTSFPKDNDLSYEEAKVSKAKAVLHIPTSSQDRDINLPRQDG